MSLLVNRDNTKIIVCCHKESVLPSDSMLLPIEVGAALHNHRLNMQADDSVGDESCNNISRKNLSFCEMTAVYWAWKNLKQLYPGIEYIGINHYRRYFAFSGVPPMQLDVVVNEQDLAHYKVDEFMINQILKKKDAIVARQLHCDTSLFNQYASRHISDDMRTTIETVHRLSPSYDDAMYEVIVRSNTFSPFNMGILPWGLFEDYCSWIFSILFEVESRIDISSYSSLQGRVFGYLSERLWNVWLYKQRIKVERLPVLTTATASSRGPIKCAVTALRKDIGFRLARPSGSWDRQEFDKYACLS